MAQRVDGFRFEDYETGDEAKEVLLQNHPIGGNVDKLVKRLEKLGAKCGPITNPKYRERPENKNLIFCSYYEFEIMFSTEWRTLIRFERGEGIQAIKDLEVLSFYQAL